jgi:predicted solute-binding protein
MRSEDYNKYLSAIEAANDTADREALRQIQKQLIAKYGLDNEDVKQLLKRFRYRV